MPSDNMKALTSLALMETRIVSADYLSTFLPFLATLILKKKYKEINIETIVRDFCEEYGLYIPRAPMQSILSRAVTSGLIEKRQNGIFYPVQNEIEAKSFLHEEKEQNRKINVLLQHFIDFANDNYNIQIDKLSAIECFIDFLDEYSPKAISQDRVNIHTNAIAIYTENQALYLMGEFIKYTAGHMIDLFEVVQNLSFAYLIAVALSFDAPAEKRVKDLMDVTIYLDTPIVFRLLGLDTDELESSYLEMFQMYKESIQPKFIIFQHTLQEITDILSDCVRWIDNPAYNPVLANQALLSFIRRKYNKTQIEVYIENIEENLRRMDIVVDKGEYYLLAYRDIQIDEKIFRQRLIETYKGKNPNYDEEKNARTIDYDVHSISNIVALWGKKSSRTYSSLGYLFLTNNTTLAYVCRKYAMEYWWDQKNHKSPCITDYYLGTMIWLSTPAEKMKNISKLKLLADCSAATTLSKEVMEKFSNTLERLKETNGITNENYLLLRNRAYQNNYLQQLTLNEETAFSDQMIDQILQDIQDEIEKPLKIKIAVKEQKIQDLLQNNRETKLELNELKKERDDETRRNIMEAKRISKDFQKLYLPCLCALFSFGFIILEICANDTVWPSISRILAAFFGICFAIMIGLLSSNKFNFANWLEDLILKFVSAYYAYKK